MENLNNQFSTLANGWNGFLTKQSENFDTGVSKLQSELDKTLGELEKDPSNPVILANYQSLLSEYTLYRNAQSNVTKAFKDIGSAIISNYR